MKNEYIVFSAHSDHIGIAKTVKKDKINNGAIDNASGTSVLMEAAKAFTEVNFQIGLALANQAQKPTWNEGDFFGETFAK